MTTFKSLNKFAGRNVFNNETIRSDTNETSMNATFDLGKAVPNQSQIVFILYYIFVFTIGFHRMLFINFVRINTSQIITKSKILGF